MKTYKILFGVVLISGILTLIAGIYLSVNQIMSIGYTSNRIGEITEGQFTGISGIFIGIFILMLSIWVYKMYKTEKKKFDELE